MEIENKQFKKKRVASFLHKCKGQKRGALESCALQLVVVTHGLTLI